MALCNRRWRVNLRAKTRFCENEQTQARLCSARFSALSSTIKLGVRPRTASAVYRLFPVLSKCLAIPSLTLEIELAFQPLLVDLSVRWLDSGEDMIGKLEASAMLIALHNELYP